MSAPASNPLPSAALVVREHKGRIFYEAKFRYLGKQLMRRVGPAWLELDGDEWTPRKGRVRDGFYDERGATVRAAEIVRGYVRDASESGRVEAERRRAGVTFRQVARDYLAWLERDKGAKPSTLKDHGYMLAEPGTPLTRSRRQAAEGHIMRELGDLPAAKVTTEHVRTVLRKVGGSPRTHNKYRNVIAAIFNFGISGQAPGYRLTINPAREVSTRAEARKLELEFFTPPEVEAIARALEAGRHRDPSRPAVGAGEVAFRAVTNRQDAEAVRVSAYCGLRQGELLALRWRDVNWAGHTLKIRRAMSAGEETTPKSGKGRTVPLSDQAMAALDRLSKRQDFTGPDELIFCNIVTGRHLDGRALYERYKRARDAEGLRALNWHALRHSFGSQLVASGIDLEQVRDAMGHGDMRTTGRYLHAKPATERAAAFTAAFATTTVSESERALERR